MAPKGRGSSGGKREDKGSDEYRRKRERNNLAVKRSRVKSKEKSQQTLQRVEKLKAENEKLEWKIEMLSKELGVLKELFVMHTGSVQGLDNMDPATLEELLKDDVDSGRESSASTTRERARIHALQAGETLHVGVGGVCEAGSHHPSYTNLGMDTE